MTRKAINGALPRDIGTGLTKVLEWEFEATCNPVFPGWPALHRCRLDPDAALGVPLRVWPAEVSQSQRSDHLC